MGENSKGQSEKTMQNISANPDGAAKGSVKGKTELTDEALKSVTGGAIVVHYQTQKPDGSLPG